MVLFPGISLFRFISCSQAKPKSLLIIINMLQKGNLNDFRPLVNNTEDQL